MNRELILLACAGLCASVGAAIIPAVEVTEAKTWRSANGETLPYRLHLPANPEPGKRYPLVLSLHGAGSRGTNNVAQIGNGVTPFVNWALKRKQEYVLLAPQCPAGKKWVDTPWEDFSHRMKDEPTPYLRMALEMTEDAFTRYPVDLTRVYVFGISMGGYATWEVVQRRPEWIAGAIPCCGGGDVTLAEKIKDVPIWAFHGSVDSTVPTSRSRDMVSALWKVNGKIRYREYPGVDHNSWTPTFSDDSVFDWLFAQRRAERGEVWLKHRLSRNYRTPRTGELDDDVEYYPDDYLDEMARDGVTGLWLLVHYEDLASTRFTPTHSQAAKRLAKLRRTAQRCQAHGLRLWLMMNDPVAPRRDSTLVKAHPDWFRPGPHWSGCSMFCPSVPEVRDYVEEATRSIFTAVPELGGIVNISNGEGETTCLSQIPCCDVDFENALTKCPLCSKKEPWQVHNLTAEAMVRGMRAGNPEAELLSWFYHPEGADTRKPWVADCARHLPEGVTMVYNFESGARKEQLGKVRTGSDYWLSFVGPSAPFAGVAAAAREAKGKLAAKIQVGNSHEMATLPYIPSPGTLYRKYRAMRAEGVSSVLQCWFFGNNPGIMNQAAGALANVDFDAESESEFLMRLARRDWGAEAPRLVRLWTAFSNAYEDYPLETSMQYYGPYAAGLVWPLVSEPLLKPLARTWREEDPIDGDFIGECLGELTLDEAATLARQMVKRATACAWEFDDLTRLFKHNPDRMRDIGVMRVFVAQLKAAADIFEYYRARRDGDVKTMRDCVNRQIALTEATLPYVEADERLGWHSEAVTRLYSPERMRQRLAQLRSWTPPKPLPPPSVRFGETVTGSNIVWKAEMKGNDCVVSGTVTGRIPGLVVSATDTMGTVYPKRAFRPVAEGAFSVTFKDFKPGRLLFLADTHPCTYYAAVLWPKGHEPILNRLKCQWMCGPAFGTIGE